jgi:hypothetical protein
MNLAFLAFGGAVLFLLGLYNWRFGVFAALILVVLEGAIRKWLLPQASLMVYFAKDGILLGAYFSYFFSARSRSAPGFREGMQLLLFAAVIWTFFQSFNYGPGSLSAGLFGWKAYVFYMPLMLMVPELFESTEELERSLRYYLVLALPVCALGVAQFYSPPDSPLNVYAPGADPNESSNIAVFGEDALVRITGTFSYISGYGAYLVVVLALLLPLLAWSESVAWRWFLGIVTALAIANSTMTGSRAVALGACLVLAGYIILSVVAGASDERSRTWVHVFAVGMGIIAMFLFFQRAVDALEQRTQAGLVAGEGQKRLWAAAFEPWDYMGEAGLLGHGNGITQPAVNALRKVFHLPDQEYEYSSPTDAENSRVLMELGIPGFFLWYGLRIGLILAVWKTRARVRSAFLRQLALGTSMVLCYQLFTTTAFSPTANVFHWFLAGFALLLPKLDAQPRRVPAPVPVRRRSRSVRPALARE